MTILRMMMGGTASQDRNLAQLNKLSKKIPIKRNVSANYLKISWCKVATVVEWLEGRACDRHGLGLKPTFVIFCVLGKNTLQHFPLLGGLGKQF